LSWLDCFSEECLFPVREHPDSVAVLRHRLEARFHTALLRRKVFHADYVNSLSPRAHFVLDSICAKLESFGLVTKTERNVNLISDNPTPYAVLQKGVDFIDYIRSESQNSA
jgi:hypothetical protein